MHSGRKRLIFIIKLNILCPHGVGGSVNGSEGAVPEIVEIDILRLGRQNLAARIPGRYGRALTGDGSAADAGVFFIGPYDVEIFD